MTFRNFLDEDCLTWLHDRLCLEGRGDWIDDKAIKQYDCPVCGAHTDFITARRVRGYGIPTPNGWRRICLVCGFVLSHEPVDEATRFDVFKTDMFTCVYCGAKPDVLSVNHVIPQAREGSHSFQNLVTACVPCNARKRDHAGIPPSFGRFRSQA